jgi:exopolysaccharide biosynthesis predicted pyruvyltransferase EpsI
MIGGFFIPIPLPTTVKKGGDKVLFKNILNSNEDYVAVRHYCISKIRQEHDTTIGGLIRSSSGAGNSHEDEDALLLDPAYHFNLGDTLLTLGTERFLHDLDLADTPQCLYVNSPLMKQLPKCSTTIMTSKTIALLQAGGNWGDLYTMPQRKRLPSIGQLLRHNVTVIGMPQSFYYQKEHNAWIDAKKLKRYVGTTQKDKVILTWREQKSYEQALIFYPFVQNRLVPDIAFQLGPFAPIRTTPELQVDL